MSPQHFLKWGYAWHFLTTRKRNSLFYLSVTPKIMRSKEIYFFYEKVFQLLHLDKAPASCVTSLFQSLDLAEVGFTDLLFGAPMNKRNSWSRNVLLDQPNQTRCECHFDHKGIVRTRTYSTHAKVCANGIWLMCPTIVIDILKYDFRNSLKCIVILSHGNFRVILWRLNSTFTYLVLRL